MRGAGHLCVLAGGLWLAAVALAQAPPASAPLAPTPRPPSVQDPMLARVPPPPRVIATWEEALARTLPSGFGFEWTGLSLEQRQASGPTVLIFVLSLCFVPVLYALPEGVRERVRPKHRVGPPPHGAPPRGSEPVPV